MTTLSAVQKMQQACSDACNEVRVRHFLSKQSFTAGTESWHESRNKAIGANECLAAIAELNPAALHSAPVQPIAQGERELPPMPYCYSRHHNLGEVLDLFTEEQMREYALAAVSQDRPAQDSAQDADLHAAACDLLDKLTADPNFEMVCMDKTTNIVGIIKAAWKNKPVIDECLQGKEVK